MESPLNSDKEAILQTVSDVFTALRLDNKPPFTAARELTYPSGLYIWISEDGPRLHSLDDGFTVLEDLRSDPDGKWSYFRLKDDGPKPEVFQYQDKMAAVWTPLEQLEIDGSVRAQMFASVWLLKPNNQTWKVAGWARTPAADPKGPSPKVQTDMTPEIERLLGFPQAMLDKPSEDTLQDYLLPGMRMVRHKHGDEPIGAPVEVFVKEQIGRMPAGVPFREDYDDMTLRVADGVGMLWMKFLVYINHKPLSHGIDMLIVLKDRESKDGRWLIAGAQTYSYPITGDAPPKGSW